LAHYSLLAENIIFVKNRHKLKIMKKDSNLEYIGEGRSAIVYKIHGTNKVLKVFFPPFAHIAKEEGDIYHQLQGIPYFPSLYEVGDNYLVIDYIEGQTLFDCLVLGIHPIFIYEILFYLPRKRLSSLT
jgi:predicted Ser/Thr protein kinase